MELLSAITSTISDLTWGPLVTFSQGSILFLLERIECGSLRIESQDGETHTFGLGGGPSSYLRVKSDVFWVRLLLFGDMVGFFERDRFFHDQQLNGKQGIFGIIYAWRSRLFRPMLFLHCNHSTQLLPSKLYNRAFN